MRKYIDVERVKEIEKTFFAIDEDKDEFIRLIDAEPAADIAPVIRAKWKVAEWSEFAANLATKFRCENCGHVAAFTSAYCPSCGAKMGGRREKQQRLL